MRTDAAVIHAIDLILLLSDVDRKKAGNVAKSVELAAALGISESFVRDILSKLSKKDILYGIRGKSGGFVIKKTLEEITVREVIDALLTEDTDFLLNANTFYSRTELSSAYLRIFSKSISKILDTSLESVLRTGVS